MLASVSLNSSSNGPLGVPNPADNVRGVLCRMDPAQDGMWTEMVTQILGSASTSLTFALSTISGELELSIFPRAWKKAEVVPHLKEGDHEVPDNHRPISFLPVLFKVAAKLVLQQCTSFLSDKNRLTKHQNGNKRYHSTETLSLLVTDHLSMLLTK